MKIRARAIIPYNDGLILIYRKREKLEKKLEYYVFPGGGVENNETNEECVIREVYEELGINIIVKKEVYRVYYKKEVQVFFLCEYISGIIGTGNGEEFKRTERGIYLPTVVSMSEFENIKILENVKNALIK